MESSSRPSCGRGKLRRSGRRVRPAAAAALGLAGLALLSACGERGDAGGGERRPNVLFVLVDTLRRDHLQLHGYARPTSPALDALAARSLVVERMYAQAPWTKPAVGSLFTSLYPRQHKALGKSSANHLPAEVDTLAELLRRAGWATTGYSENPHVQVETGFGQGFERFDGTPGFRSFTQGVVKHTVELLRGAHGRQPFFHYVHFLDPHGPYTPSERHRAEFVGARTTERDLVRRGRVGDLIGARDVPREPLSAADVDYLRALYDAEIRSIDDALARILLVLAEEGLADDTLVVVTSDHGEEFLEHGGFKHGFRIHDELLRVPFLLHVPGAAPRRLASTIVQQIDVAPTLLELLGIPAPPELQGRSFAGALRGAELAPQPAIAECSWEGLDLRAIRTEEWKLILDGHGADMLFRVDRDPGETENVIAQHPEVVAELTALMEERLGRYAGPDAASARGVRDQGIEDAMDDLGYGGGE